MTNSKIGFTNGFSAMASLRKAAADHRVAGIEGNGMEEGRVFIHLAKGYWFGEAEGTHLKSCGNAAELRDVMSRIEVEKLDATVADVNAELKKLGFSERLTRGRGYMYFRAGHSCLWRATAVYVSDVSVLTVAEWIEERARLAAL